MALKEKMREVEEKAKEYARKGRNVVGNLTGRREVGKISRYLRSSTRK